MAKSSSIYNERINIINSNLYHVEDNLQRNKESRFGYSGTL